MCFGAHSRGILQVMWGNYKVIVAHYGVLLGVMLADIVEYFKMQVCVI